MATQIPDYLEWVSRGGIYMSSGTTGPSKEYYQPPQKILASSIIGAKAQNITKDSRVLTVCKMSHAGGMGAQTLPALHAGAHVDVEAFNAFTFIEQVKDYTHTHITPGHIELLSKTKGFEDARYDGLFVACGSDRVEWWMIEYFVSRGATFMTNWGMSEIGPIAINATYSDMNKITYHKGLCPEGCTILGDTKWCDYKVVDGELFVKGDICIYDDWYATKDNVIVRNDVIFYAGRTNLPKS